MAQSRLEEGRNEEHARGRQAQAHHLQQRALQAGDVHREQAEHDDADMADAGVGEQPAQIGLHEGDQCAVDQAAHAQASGQPQPLGRRGGQQGQHEPQHAIGAQLEPDQEHAHADHRALLEYARQPGMQRKQRRLDAQAQQQQQERQRLRAVGQACGEQVRQCRGAAGTRQPQPGADQRAGREHDHHVLARAGVALLAGAMACDQVGAGHHLGGEEGHEQQRVGGREGAVHAGGESQQRSKVAGLALRAAAFVRREHGQGAQQRRQRQEPQAGAVDAEPVGAHHFGELQRRRVVAKGHHDPQRQADLNRAQRQCKRLGGQYARASQQQCSAQQRQPHEQREDRKPDLGGSHHQARSHGVKLPSTAPRPRQRQ